MIITNNKVMKKFALLVAAVCFAFSTASMAATTNHHKKTSSKPAATVSKNTVAKSNSNSKIIPVDRIAAVVNNDVVTEVELQQRIHQTALNLRRQNIALPPMEAMRDQILERIIVERLIEQKARETGVRVDDNMLNMAIEQIANNNHLSVPELERRLALDGISMKNFRIEVRSQILTQRLREREVDEQIKIPESEIDQYIKDQFGPEKRKQYLLSRIVFPIPENVTQPQLEEIQKKATRVLQQAMKGGDFGKLAAQYSISSEAVDGGSLGWKSASTLPPAVFEGIKGKGRGEIVPVRTSNAFHIYKVQDSRDPGDDEKATAIEQTRVRHILMRPTDVTPEDVVVKRLRDIKTKIESGQADFQTIARLHSADPSGTKGGDLGWLYPGDVPPEMEAEIAKLHKGQISEPIKTQFGWHLVQLTDKRTLQGVNERIRMQALDNLREQKLNDAVVDWERKMRDEAYIEKRNPAAQQRED